MTERHILLVDDDESDLLWLKTLAESIGDDHDYIIYLARNAGEAVKAYVQNPIECAIIDYNMPGDNGVELIKVLHGMLNQIALHAPLPVVVVSGSEDPRMMEHVRSVDAMRFAVKKDIRSSDDFRMLVEHMLSASKGDESILCS